MSEIQKKPRPKSEKRKRNILKSFRLNEEELAAFQQNCKEAVLTGGDLFRVKCCGKPPIKKKGFSRPDEKQLAAILAQLGKYGSNLNQIAHVLNIANKEPSFSPRYAVSRLDEYQSQIKQLEAAIFECRTLVRETLLGHDTIG